MFKFVKSSSRQPRPLDRVFLDAIAAAERDAIALDYASDYDEARAYHVAQGGDGPGFDEAMTGPIADDPIEHRSGGWLARKAEGKLPAADLTGHRGLVL